MALTIHDQELNTVKEEKKQLELDNSRLRTIASKLMISGVREPNPDDAPYRPAPIPNPGQPPWPGYPNPPRLAGNPSFDINETPATRRTRKIRTLQERGVGGEAGNASDILKKGIQLPDIKAELNPNQLKILQEIPSNLNKRNPSERLKIMRDITGRVLKAQGKQETIGPAPINPVGTDLFIRPSDQRRIRDFDKYFGSKLA